MRTPALLTLALGLGLATVVKGGKKNAIVSLTARDSSSNILGTVRASR